MKETDKSIQVYLKLNDGLFTRKIPIPKEFVRPGAEYRIPLKVSMNMHQINLSQPLMDDLTKIPVLVFSPNGQIHQGIFVMELVRTEHF